MKINEDMKPGTLNVIMAGKGKYKSFWEYKAEPPEANPPTNVNMTITEWETLSPGYRRAISKEYNKGENR